MAKYTTLNELFTAIANSLRSKTGGTSKIVADDFPTVIDGLDTNGIHPTGTKSITTNGTHDVTSYASASVNVPTGTNPTGTKTITTNGTHDVTNYANAQVNVPVGITPSGSKNITENGTYDVADFESAVVDVPIPAQKTVVRTVTLSAAVTGAGANTNLLSGDAFIKEHYADTGFFAVMFPVTPVASATGTVHFIYHGNKNVGSSNVSRTGVVLKSTSASAIGIQVNTARIDGKGYNASLRVASDGSMKCYLANGYNLEAGTYQIVMTCIDE
jgi:hypothetical protein